MKMANSLHMSTRTITIRIFHDNFRKQGFEWQSASIWGLYVIIYFLYVMSPIWNNIFLRTIMWVTYVIIYFSLWNRGNNIYFDFLHVLNLEIWKGKNHEHKDAWTHTLGPKSVEWTNHPWVWTSKNRLNQKKICANRASNV